MTSRGPTVRLAAEQNFEGDLEMSLKHHFASLLFVIFAVSQAFAQVTINVQNTPQPAWGPIPYYGPDFYNQMQQGLNNEPLKASLRTILRSGHIAGGTGFDQIVPHCSGPGCYGHTILGYDKARQILLGQMYLIPMGPVFGVRDVYCQAIYPSALFVQQHPGPGIIPDEHVVNTEHTWPQSRFNPRFDREMQKSDLHHLYPADSLMNNIRGNFEFGHVTHDMKPLKCPISHFGIQDGRRSAVFEPPPAHRGHVARALFYFSVKYELPLSPDEEAILRQWHHENPVDTDEMARNNAIQKVQGSRNPFIDYPQLVDKISKF